MWFAAEFFIVVAGILAALVVQSWWEGRADRKSERIYLQLLTADLAQTERDIVLADGAALGPENAGARLLDAYQSPTPPPADSVVVWLAHMRPFQNPRPTLGSFEALVGTGDLRLIRNDSLRTRITAYLDLTRANIHSADRAVEMVNSQYIALNQLVDYADLVAATVRPVADSAFDPARDAFRFARPGARRRRFPLDGSSILESRAIYGIVVSLQISKRTLANRRRSMLEDARELRTAVEAELQQR